MSSCCQPPKPEKASCCTPKQRVDILLWGSFFLCAVGYGLSFMPYSLFEPLSVFAHGVQSMVHQMWWGVLLGIGFIMFLHRVPQAIISRILGDGQTVKGILRATCAGVLLDLCNHGILMVAASLYKKGVSTAQVMAFLVASPWNSFSLLFVLWALIGWQWTLAFTLLSMGIAFMTGLIFRFCEKRGILPENPHTQAVEKNISFKLLLREWLQQEKEQFSRKVVVETVFTGVRESRIVLKWLLVGIVLASVLRAVVDAENFAQWFAPTFGGLMLTSLAATVIEVCSEGSVPLASDIFHFADAPGNSFAFLMTGVSTDYTEVMILKETTSRWKIALFLPLITLPQVLLLSLLLNNI